MILSSRVILSVYHILVCMILIAVFSVFSQILKFRLDFIPVLVVGCTLYGILAGYWVIISRISLVVAVVVYISFTFAFSLNSSISRLLVILHQLDLLNHSSSL